MAREVDLFETFKDKGVFSGRELIVFKKFCSEFLKASVDAGYAVIGIEGFHLSKNGGVTPNLDEIADFSDIDVSCSRDSYIEACSKAARSFLHHMLADGRSDGYSFTLVDTVDH